jgi:hypothetical protein
MGGESNSLSVITTMLGVRLSRTDCQLYIRAGFAFSSPHSRQGIINPPAKLRITREASSYTSRSKFRSCQKLLRNFIHNPAKMSSRSALRHLRWSTKHRLHNIAARDMDHLPGNIGGDIGCHDNGNGGDIHGGAHPTEGESGEHSLPHLFVLFRRRGRHAFP